MVCVKRENSVPFSFQITLPTKKIILVLSSWEQNPSIREAISEKEYGNRQNASISRQAKHPIGEPVLLHSFLHIKMIYKVETSNTGHSCHPYSSLQLTSISWLLWYTIFKKIKTLSFQIPTKNLESNEHTHQMFILELKIAKWQQNQCKPL